jgi:hypothetical protein
MHSWQSLNDRFPEMGAFRRKTAFFVSTSRVLIFGPEVGFPLRV